MRDGGKGDTPRPINNREEFEKNWETIFKSMKERNEETIKQLEEHGSDYQMED
jgi:hypothetical protein